MKGFNYKGEKAIGGLGGKETECCGGRRIEKL
jgi:hypothetical protein